MSSSTESALAPAVAVMKKNMNLYKNNNVNYIVQRARKLQKEIGAANLKPEHLLVLDQLHYCGTERLEKFVENYLLRSQDKAAPLKLLDIGAGVGGPTRLLASKYSFHVDAVEYLPEFVEAAKELNSMCASSIAADTVRMLCDDFTSIDLRALELFRCHDAAISQLCVLHIADKTAVFRNAADSLRDGAYLYVEDFFCLQELDEVEHEVLERHISVPRKSLLTEQQYTELLAQHGFDVVSWEDTTSAWSEFIWKRSEAFISNREELQREYGEAHFEEMSDFFQQVARVYHHELGPSIATDFPQTFGIVGEQWTRRPQNLGGVCFVAVKRGSSMAA